MRRTVSDLIAKMDFRDAATIDKSASVEEAIRILRQSETGALLVMCSGVVTGIFSERDFARAVVANGFKLSPDTRASDLMTKKVIYVTPDYRLDECLAVMIKMRVRYLPILNGDKPITLLSMRHIMGALIEDNRFMVDQLMTYITGSSVSEEQILRSGLTRYNRRQLDEKAL